MDVGMNIGIKWLSVNLILRLGVIITDVHSPIRVRLYSSANHRIYLMLWCLSVPRTFFSSRLPC
jgi:hypothetical protein